jgi:hypothetical protein
LLTPDATPDWWVGTAFNTVAVKGAITRLMPRLITTTAGK